MTDTTPADTSGIGYEFGDLDAWIDAPRPETTVLLYGDDAAFIAETERIVAAIEAAERVGDGNRGLDEPSPEQLALRFEQLRAERDAKALRVRVRQLTDAEIKGAGVKAAIDGGSTDPETLQFWIIAEACVEPRFTPEQLRRLRARDRAGERAVNDLATAIGKLQTGLTVPFSPAPSGATPTSSPSSAPPARGASRSRRSGKGDAQAPAGE